MRFKYFIYVLGMMLCCACADEEAGGISEQKTEVLTISDAVIYAAAWTKALVNDTLTSDSIGVFRLAANKYKAKANAKFKYKDSWWIATGSDTLCLNKDTALICAYYPYGAAGITDKTDITKIFIKSQKYDKKQDLCYQTTCKVNEKSPKVKLLMRRAYAKLTFVITHQMSYKGICHIDSIAIMHPSMRTNAILNITNGGVGSVTASTAGYKPVITINSAKTDSTQMLMVPGASIDTDVNFTGVFWVDGMQKNITFSLSDKKFVSGYNYRFPIYISDKAEIMFNGGVVMTDWEGNILPEINL